MTGIIALLINLLILALIVVVVMWVIDLVASAIGFPPKVAVLLKAIIVLIALLLSTFPNNNGPDGFTATKAIAADADISVTAVAKRRCDTRRLRVKH